MLAQQGRPAEAIRYAQAEVADDLVHNIPMRSQAGRVLGTCHAALGQPSLSRSAFDAALQLAKPGRFLWSEALVLRGRALAERELGSATAFDEAQARQGVAEVVSRMHVGRGEAAAKMEALLLPPPHTGGQS